MKKGYSTLFIFSLILSVCGLSISTNGQSSFQGDAYFSTYTPKNSYSDEIYLKSLTITPEKLSLSGNIDYSNSEIINNGILRIIQFSEIPSNDEKQRLLSAGIELMDYIPNRAFLAFLPSNITYEKLESFKVQSITKLLPTYKKGKYLTENYLPDYAKQGSKIRINLVLFAQTNANSFLDTQNKIEVEVLDANANTNTLELWVERNQLDALLTNKYVKFAELGAAPPTLENSTGRTQHRSNTINTSYLGGEEYDGSGVVIMVQDDGNIGPHIDFEGRLDQSNIGGAGGNHGDHVTGIFMGAGNLDPLGKGMAPGAFGIVYGSSNANYNTVPNHYLVDSLRITTKSYGDGCNGPYSTLTRDLDQQTIINPSLIHVFSAGNSGTGNCGYGAGAGWGTITGGHKIGKNVLAVASLLYDDSRSSFSSRGPSSDGRIKPDISAKGQNVYSTLGNNSYGNNSGTSMAAPGVTGILGQLYHAFKDVNNGAEPNSGLMKGIILNSADDLGNPGPDYSFGWGRINADNAFEIISNHQYLDSTISSLSTNSHTINVPAGTSRLKIMLYWKDPQASAFASPALVNDLNLTVNDPSLNTYLPLVLDPTPNATTLNLPASPGVDNLNNMEQVVINTPTAGNYQVSVSGFQVPQGPQEYYIIYRFERDEVQLTYPIGGEPFVPGETQTIRWDAYDNNTPFSIEYSLDSGANWTVINSSVPGSQRYFDWNVPFQSSGKALVKITQGTSSSTSIVPFSIIGTPNNLNVVWSCTDSLLLSWDSVVGANSYEVSMLGNKYMDSIGTSANSFFTVKNISSSNTYWLSVKALNTAQGIIGRRAIAIQKVPGIFQCPVPVDVSVSRIVSPENSQMPSCQNLDSADIIIEIENNGSSRQGNFPVSVLLNNGTTSTIQFTDTLELYEKRSIPFPVTADLSTGNSHFFKAWTSLAGDGQTSNDTANSLVTIYSGQSVNIPLVQSFDQFSLCPTATNCGATICNLSNGWINTINGFGDDIDWRTNTGGTASGNTGPSSDHTSGNGNYLYLEASGNPVCSDKTAILNSPCIDLTFAIQPELSFWYHMQGADMGELHVDVLANGVWFTDVMTPLIGQQGNSWLQRTIDLTPFAGQVVNVRLRGITGSDFASDLAIDDISVIDNFVYAIDASITSLLSPNFSSKEDCLLEDSLEVKVVLQNTGANAIGNIPMNFSVNGGPLTTGVYNNILQAGAIDTFTFATALNLPGVGNYELKVWQNYGPDQNPGNDTVETIMNITPGNVFPVPYNQTFDAFTNCATTTNCELTVCNLTGGWRNYSNSTEDDIDWRVNNGSTASQNTGPSNDQNTGNITGKYLYLEASGNPVCSGKTAILQSPCIDLSNVFSPELKVWYHMFGQDMGELHFDVFLGDSWFNDFVPPIIGNQGNSWQQWTIDLSLIAGNTVSVRFRGITGSDFASDLAIDNISITDNFSTAQANFSFSQPNCAGQNIVFTDNSSGTGLNHYWDFGANASPATASGVGPHNVTFTNTGINTVQLIVNNVSGSDTNSQNLLIDTLPEGNFIWSTNLDTVSFINQSSNASSYSWDFGDGNTDNSFQPTHVYASPGIYTVTLTVNNGCGPNTISKDVTVGMVGIKNNLISNVKAYPNPNNGTLFIKGLSLGLNNNFKIRISDMKGSILNFNYSILSHDELMIDLKSFPEGLYLLKIESEDVNAVMKIEKR